MNNSNKTKKEWCGSFSDSPSITIEILDLLRGFMGNNKHTKYNIKVQIEPSVEDEYKRGHVVEVDFGDEDNNENKGVQSVVIVQNDVGNKYSSTIIVVPVKFDENKIKHYDIQKITTIDKDRVIRKLTENKYDISDILKELVYNLKNYDSKNVFLKRGTVVYADFGETVGSEQNGVRPCIVLQNNINNHCIKSIIVAPLSLSNKKNLPTHYRLDSPIKNEIKPSVILFEQIREVNLSKIVSHVDFINIDEHTEIDDIIQNKIFGTIK